MRCFLPAVLAILSGCGGHHAAGTVPPVESTPADAPASRESSQLELDHLFIRVEENAPEAELLRELGLQPSGMTHRHVGLGTEGTYFFFENAYLELLWVADEEEFAAAREEVGDPRIGIAFHRRGDGESPLPFPTRAVRWDWMSPGTYLHIEDREPTSTETFVFVVPAPMRYRGAPPELTTHPNGARRLTGVRVVQAARPSPTARTLSERSIVRIEEGAGPVLELTFDDGARREVLDAGPGLPLIVRY